MTPAVLYGLMPPAPAAAPTTPSGAPTMASPDAPAVATAPRAPGGWHQHPLLVLLLLLLGAFVLARLAEHGISFGLWERS